MGFPPGASESMLMKAYKKYEIISRKHDVKLIRQKESRESKKVEESVEVNPVPPLPRSPPAEVPRLSVPAVPSCPDPVSCLICGKMERGLMIQCDDCEEWVHGQCANLDAREANILPSFSCRSCSLLSIGAFLLPCPPPVLHVLSQLLSSAHWNTLHL